MAGPGTPPLPDKLTDPSVTISLPTRDADGNYTFKGAVYVGDPVWTPDATANVKVTPKGGGTAIPFVTGAVSDDKKSWGPSAAVASALMPQNTYIAVVELRFTRDGQRVTKTNTVEFAIQADGSVAVIGQPPR